MYEYEDKEYPSGLNEGLDQYKQIKNVVDDIKKELKSIKKKLDSIDLHNMDSYDGGKVKDVISKLDSLIKG